MQVLIGAPGHETPVTMTRVTANGYGDKVGESSDTIATRVSNPKPADRRTPTIQANGRRTREP